MMLRESYSVPNSVLIFGGTGFLGRNLTEFLVNLGWNVSVFTRKIPSIVTSHFNSKVTYIKGDVRNADSVESAISGAVTVVNLVGILYEEGNKTFEAMHHTAAQNIANAARKFKIKNLIHVSAIGTDISSDSSYARSKGEGERAVKSIFPNAIIFKPSIIFGREDNFFNRFSAMAQWSPFLPLIGGGSTLFQPVYVVDVARAITLALEAKIEPGKIYELGGPKTYSFRDLLTYICKTLKIRRIFISLPFPVAMIAAKINQFCAKLAGSYFPKTFLITPDQVKLLRKNNVVCTKAIAEGRTLEGLGIKPESVYLIVPKYLY